MYGSCAGWWKRKRAWNSDDRDHILVTDLVMPEIGGRELAKLLRQGNPTLKIAKPFSVNKLLETVEHLTAGG